MMANATTDIKNSIGINMMNRLIMNWSIRVFQSFSLSVCQ